VRPPLIGHLILKELSGAAAIHAVVEQIILVESNGDPNAKNRRSTAMGLIGAFAAMVSLVVIVLHLPRQGAHLGPSSEET
jgi:hypothetical protein